MNSLKKHLLIREGQILTMTGQNFKGDILIEDGKISQIGSTLEVPEGAQVIEAEGVMCFPDLLMLTVMSG